MIVSRKENLIMSVRNHLEYYAVAGLLQGSRLLPRSWVYGLYNGIVLLMYALLADRRKISLKNLEIAFPEKSEAERKKLARLSYQNLGEALALNTLIMTKRVSDEELMGMVEMEGFEAFLERRAQHKAGCLVITGHFGNWELLPQYAGLKLTEQLHVISRKTDNPVLEEKIVFPLRKRFGMTVFYKQNALVHIMKAVKRGHICAMQVDQKLNPPEGFFMDFFGRPAPTVGTPALLTIRFGIPVQSVFLVRTAPKKYRLILPKPIPWEDNGKSMEEQVHELTFLHHQQLEEMIRKHPEQWFWMHNRWGLKKEER